MDRVNILLHAFNDRVNINNAGGGLYNEVLMMKILAFSNENSGCGWHRLIMPMAYMDGIRGHLTNKPTAKVMHQAWDILFYNRMSPFDLCWIDFRKTSNMKVVMDIDDWWILPPSHVNYSQYKSLQPRIENNLRHADLVTVTHERLADKCRPFNDNVVIMPNAIPFGCGQYIEDREDSDKVRLFWAGGVSHVKDMELLRHPMKRIKEIQGIETVIGGYNESDPYTISLWQRMIGAFTCGLQIPGCVLKSLPVQNYMEHWRHADILLLPLENSEWHGMKSNLKLLEAASKGIPVICSKVLPYTQDNPPVLWVEKQSDWYKNVKALMNKNFREQKAGELKEWAKQFNLFDVNKIRQQCFEELLLKNTGTSLTSSTEQGNSLISV